MNKSKASADNNWVIELRQACINQGIDNAFQLWQKIGGSKATTAQLWKGQTKMIKVDTINRLHNLARISPDKYLNNKKGNTN